MLVLRNLPRRDCVRRPTGAADPAAYRRWITGVSGGIGGRAALVVLEPAAVAGLVAG
ncbi:hypothetical protein ACFV3E_36510 [Streptomyces sp. NPDC059718]